MQAINPKGTKCGLAQWQAAIAGCSICHPALSYLSQEGFRDTTEIVMFPSITFYCRPLLVCSLLLSAATASSLKVSPNSSVRSVPGEEDGNYGAAHVYVDELAAESIPLTVFFDPQTLGVDRCEVFTNLNRRERAGADADGDGVEDGINSPNGNSIASGSDAHYFKPYLMTLVSGGYQTTLFATRTGMYRLTVRWRLTSDAPGTWRWSGAESSGGYQKRDYADVGSPKISRSMSVYEINAMNMEAKGTSSAQRSTFVDL